MFFLFSDGCHVGCLDQVLLESKLPPAPTSAERLKRKRIYVGSTIPYHTIHYHTITYHTMPYIHDCSPLRLNTPYRWSLIRESPILYHGFWGCLTLCGRDLVGILQGMYHQYYKPTWGRDGMYHADLSSPTEVTLQMIYKFISPVIVGG